MANPMHGRLAALYTGTKSELALEPAVAALGVPYRTNFPLYLYQGGMSYFPDFVLPSLRLVIEVDGQSHRGTEAEDSARAAEMWQVFGWVTVRCTNEEAESDPYGTVRRLLEEAGFAPPPYVLSPASWGMPLPRERPASRRKSPLSRGTGKRARARRPSGRRG